MTRSFTSRRRSSPSCGKLKCRRVRQASSGRGSVDWGYRGDVLSLAFGVCGLKLYQLRRLKVPEQENGRLRNALASLPLEKPILKEGLRETTERCASSGVRGARLGQAGQLAAPCLPRAAAASLDAVPGTEDGRRRGSVDFGDYRLGSAVWALWLPPDHRPAADRGAGSLRVGVARPAALR